LDWAGLAGLRCLTEYGHPSFPQNLHLVVVRLLPKDKEAHPLSSRELRPFKDILQNTAGAVKYPPGRQNVGKNRLASRLLGASWQDAERDGFGDRR